jgi:hypothetical protein
MARKSKMTKCKSCGTEISAVGKVTCPKCGRVNKPPFYKSAGFIILCIVLVIVIACIAGNSSDTDKTTKNSSVVTSENAEIIEVEPMAVTAGELVQALDDNALKAANTYKNTYVILTGKLSSIDSDGKYFSLKPASDDFTLTSVTCNIGKEHLDKVMNFTGEQEVTVIGTITSVGEFMGYSVKVESIK